MKLIPNFLKPYFVAITYAYIFEIDNGIGNTVGEDGSSRTLS
jgi:hypothetical protein